MSEDPLLSVVIPTRNRVATLVPTVRNVLRCGGPDVEVVVHDTSDTRDAEAILAAEIGADPRLRYFYTAPPQSFAQTFDKSVSLAQGRFVTIIGDDDGILSSLVELTRHADQHGWDAVTPTLPAAYFWPDFRHAYYGDSDAGRLSLRPFGQAIGTVDIGQELLASARGGFQEFTRLPRIYYGIVRRSCLDELRVRAGGCFFGSTPDISGAVGLAQVVRTLMTIDFPVFLPGSSAASGAGRSGMKTHSGSLADTPQTAAFASTWPHQVPPVYAVQTVWAQAALATLDQLDVHGTRDRLDVGRLHAQTLVHNPAFRGEVLASLRSNARGSKRNAAGLWWSFAWGSVREAAKRGRGLFYRVTGSGYYRYDWTEVGIPTIDDAAVALESKLAERGESISQVLARAGTPTG